MNQRTFDDKYLEHSRALDAQKAMPQHRRCDPVRGNAKETFARLGCVILAVGGVSGRGATCLARLVAAALPTAEIAAIKCTLIYCRSSSVLENLSRSYNLDERLVEFAFNSTRMRRIGPDI